MTTTPWSFSEAREACRRSSLAQKAAEDAMRNASRDAALAEERYRVELAKAIVEAHDSGVAWSVAADVARGAEDVASLRRDRDIAEGVRDALVQAAWRAAADRRDTSRFAQWGMSVALRDGSIGPDEPRLVWSGQAGAA